jgi:hypothetical protein
MIIIEFPGRFDITAQKYAMISRQKRHPSPFNGEPSPVRLTAANTHPTNLGWLSSGPVMYPAGHARRTSGEIEALLQHGSLPCGARSIDVEPCSRRCSHLKTTLPQDRVSVYNVLLLSPTSYRSRRCHDGERYRVWAGHCQPVQDDRRTRCHRYCQVE